MLNDSSVFKLKIRAKSRLLTIVISSRARRRRRYVQKNKRSVARLLHDLLIELDSRVHLSNRVGLKDRRSTRIFSRRERELVVYRVHLDLVSTGGG